MLPSWVSTGCCWLWQKRRAGHRGRGLEASVGIDSVYCVKRGRGSLWVLQESQVQISHALPGRRELSDELEQDFEPAYQVFSL